MRRYRSPRNDASGVRVFRRALAFIAVFVWLVGCGKSDTSENETDVGALFVQVRDQYGAEVPNAALTTEPRTADRSTDAAGTAIFTGIEAGSYRVTGEHEVAGVGSVAVRVYAEELTRVTIELDGSLGGSGGANGGSTGVGGSSTGGTRGGSSGSSGQGGSSGTGQGGAGTGGGPVGPYIDVATQVETMLIDPERSYLYALDRVNNAFLFVNLDTEMLEKTIFVGSTPVDMDFSDDASEIFVANFGGTEISVVDLETQEVGRSIFVDPSQSTWDGNPHRLAVTAGNTLVYTSEDQWNDVKLVNAETGVFIAVAGSIYEPDLAASPDGTKVYAAESGLSSSHLYRFDVTATAVMQVDESPDVGFGSTRNVVLSGNGEFAFYAGRKILASNLQSVVGDFSEMILASNDDGTLVAGSTNVFDGMTFSVLAPLVVATEVLAMTPDGTTLYLYDVNSSRIYIQDLTDL
jgi:DNA-binding beta-propeller fold protein YncE